MGADRKIAVVEYLRGAAALAVTWFHVTNQYPWGTARQSGSLGWLGVAIFFVISGYVLPHAIWGRHQENYKLSDFGAFARRRLIRIEPPYLLSVLLAVALWHLSTLAPGFRGSAPNVTWGQLLAHLGYLPSVFGYSWLQPVYWTLAYEFVFYAMLGMTYPLLLRRPLPTMTILVAASMGLGMLLRGAPDAHIPLFAMGGAIFLAQRSFLSQPALWAVLAAAGLAAGVVNWTIAATGLLTALAIHFGYALRGRGKLHQIALFAGTISYSLYITHVPIGGRIVNLGARFVSTEPGRLLVSVSAMAVSLAFAALFWYFVERRFVALASQPRTTSAGPTPVAPTPFK